MGGYRQGVSGRTGWLREGRNEARRARGILRIGGTELLLHGAFFGHRQSRIHDEQHRKHQQCQQRRPLQQEAGLSNCQYSPFARTSSDVDQTSVVCSHSADISGISRKPARTNGFGAVLWVLRAARQTALPSFDVDQAAAPTAA